MDIYIAANCPAFLTPVPNPVWLSSGKLRLKCNYDVIVSGVCTCLNETAVKHSSTVADDMKLASVVLALTVTV